MGEIHFLVDGHFKMLFIVSPAANEPTVCNSWGFYSPFASAMQDIDASGFVCTCTPHSLPHPAGLTLLRLQQLFPEPSTSNPAAVAHLAQPSSKVRVGLPAL